MRTTFRTLLGTAAVVASAVTVPAHATPTFATASAAECSVTLAADPTAEPGTMSGQLSGGGEPAPAGAPVTGTLICRVVVGATDHSGPGPAVSGHGSVVMTVGPAIANLTVDDYSVSLCEEVVDDSTGIEYYWDATAREWSTAWTVDCEVVIQGVPIEPSRPETWTPPPAADCPYGRVTGDIAYATPVTAISAPVGWTMHLHADCAGTGVPGHYELTLVGHSTESCTAGTGGAQVTGTGPNGPLTGTWSFTRGGIHYYGYAPSGSGHFTDSSGTHQMAWWLDLFPTGADTACPIPAARIVGHGLLTF